MFIVRLSPSSLKLSLPILEIEVILEAKKELKYLLLLDDVGDVERVDTDVESISSYMGDNSTIIDEDEEKGGGIKGP